MEVIEHRLKLSALNRILIKPEIYQIYLNLDIIYCLFVIILLCNWFILSTT